MFPVLFIHIFLPYAHFIHAFILGEYCHQDQNDLHHADPLVLSQRIKQVSDSPHKYSPFSYKICMDKKAGTMTITSTTASIRNMGRRSFVPASSPSLLALAFLSSNAWIDSIFNNWVSPLVPFLRFWDNNAPNLRYACTLQRLPKFS